MPLDKVSGQSVTQSSGGSGVDSSYKVPPLSGVTSSSYPKQTPSVSGGMGKGDKLSPGDMTPVAPGTANVIPGLTGQMLDDIANGYLAKDQNGKWYNPRAPQGFEKAFDEIMPFLVAAATIYAGGAAFAGAGSAAAATTVPGVAASTAAAGEAAVATSTAVAGAGGAAATAAGTLEEIVVTAQAAGGLSAEAAAALSAGATVTAGAIDLTGASGSSMPTANYGSSTLQKIGMNALKQGGINAAMSAVMGGDPLKGFERGFIGGTITGGLGAFEAGSGALDALGSTGIKAVNAAVAAAGTAAIMGGDPLRSGFTGGISSLAGSALSDIMGTGGNKFDVGQALGSAAGSIAVSQILGGGKVPNFRTTGGGIGAQTTPSVTKPAPNQSFDPYKATNFPSIRDTPITYPSVPYYGVGYRAGGGDVASSDDEGYFQDQEKLKKLLAALMQQQGGAYG